MKNYGAVAREIRWRLRLLTASVIFGALGGWAAFFWYYGARDFEIFFLATKRIWEYPSARQDLLTWIFFGAAGTLALAFAVLFGGRKSESTDR